MYETARCYVTFLKVNEKEKKSTPTRMRIFLHSKIFHIFEHYETRAVCTFFIYTIADNPAFIYVPNFTLRAYQYLSYLEDKNSCFVSLIPICKEIFLVTIGRLCIQSETSLFGTEW